MMIAMGADGRNLVSTRSPMAMNDNAAYIKRMLATEDAQLARLHRIVEEAMNEERSLAARIAEEGREDRRGLGERLADQVASFGGSWTFILSFLGILVVWIILNAIFLHEKGFDPYPFILLNLVLSCIAALQAPVIMMSQNRKEAKDRLRAENDYLINLRAELEIRSLHRKLDLSIEDQFKHLCSIQQMQLDQLERLDQRLVRMESNLPKG
ncbi:MAG: DUF1003 domain-containing protein [Flavobacteriales bacterium]|nr:MAG: DUF1003 domain-containing protein [Flavobacteriales bacterium]